MEAAIHYLRGLTRPGDRRCVPEIVFLGHVCRTSYADEHVMCAVMEILYTASDYAPVHTKPTGFDLMVNKIATALGFLPIEIPPMAFDDIGRSIRDPDMLDSAMMVVAFPMERPATINTLGKVTPATEKESWETADPAMAEIIKAIRIPTLVVYRTGETVWLPPRGE